MKARMLLVCALLTSCKESTAPLAAESMQAARPMTAGGKVLNFDGDAAGASPAGFTAGRTGGGRTGVWRVERAQGPGSAGQAVIQSDDDRTNYRFPVLVYDGLQARNLDVSVRFQPVSGKVDQAAGLVWRYRDPDNYYVVRANALEDNVVLYKVQNGKRGDLPVRGVAGNTYGVKAEVPDAAWSTLRVTARDRLFEVYLNGRKLFEVEDPTFDAAGKVGLWTKADSVTRFDDLTVATLDTPTRQ